MTPGETIAVKQSSPGSAHKPASGLRRWAIRGGVAIVVLLAAVWGLFNWFIALQNRNMTSGIALGQGAPDFALRDQNGRVRSLRDLSGPKGLLLVFVRSADW
jgi:cytochrome oxidase Cu insertion factor (SCO1/SenC/PrrC family)